MTQLRIPIEVQPHEVLRKTTLGGAISLCAELAGFEGKQIQHDLLLDKAQWSRWESGAEGVVWPKLESLMDHCGNDAPVLWMLGRRGYDLHSVRRLESELEKENRELKERQKHLMALLRAT